MASELKLWEEEENERKSRWEESPLLSICSVLSLHRSSYTSLTSCSIVLLLAFTKPVVSPYNAASLSSKLFFFYSIADGHTKLHLLVTSY